MENWIYDQHTINCQIEQYYQNLFTTSHTGHRKHPSILAHHTLKPEQLTCLSLRLTTQEILRAVKSFQTLKAPGSDGLHPLFYQNYWIHIAPSLVSFYKEVFDKQHIPLEVNKIYLCLIPKILHPTLVTFGPLAFVTPYTKS